MEKPNRKLPRMNGFDYSQEAVYFVTICSHENKHIFGEVSRIGDTNVFSPSRIGELVKEIFFRLPERFPEFSLIHFSLLPNHLHFLTMKMKTDPETERSLSDLVGAFKSLSYRAVRNEIPGIGIWQNLFTITSFGMRRIYKPIGTTLKKMYIGGMKMSILNNN